MAKRTTTETFQSSTTNSREHSQSQSQSQSQSTTKKLLDSELLNQILGGLAGNMTDKEIAAFAETCCGRSSTRGLRPADRILKRRS